jgi:hypothetical protein
MFTYPKRKSPGPFRVTIHDGAATFRLELRGAFTAAGVDEVEQCWRTAESTIAGRELLVDLGGVTAFDPAAKGLLARMRDRGARLVSAPQRGKSRLADLLGCLLFRLRNRAGMEGGL